MDVSDCQDQLEAVSSELLECGQTLAKTALSVEDVSIDDVVSVKSKPKFQCPDCKKSYTTKKSLQRHLNNLGNECGNVQLTDEQITSRLSKPRWKCSRCGKDCATSASVERHISKSCWRNCDECATAGIARCDSMAKTGPCRVCEGKGVPCMKHASAIIGTKAVQKTGARSKPQLKWSTEEKDTPVPKRKTTTSPNASPQRAREHKRPKQADQQVVDYGSDRVCDPLGAQAYVPPRVKETAVSNWLEEQSMKSASAASIQGQVQDDPSNQNQNGSTESRYFLHQQPSRSSSQTQTSGTAFRPPAGFLPSQYGNTSLTPSYQQQLQTRQTVRNQHALENGPTPGLENPPFGGLPFMTVGRSTQLNQMYLQMQKVRQQSEALDLEVARQNDPRNSAVLPSFSINVPPNYGGRGLVYDPSRPNYLPLHALRSSQLDPSDQFLTLRIQSNTYDKNGQPIFSILCMRAKETFGPRLDAYCAVRGKQYGVDWMFVFRYQPGTYQNPGHHLDLTLKWDMTPADVKVDGIPSVAMRNMDTIHVVRAKAPAATGTQGRKSEGGAVQSAWPQASQEIVDIISGETQFYQKPDVTRQWSQVLQRDNNHLRASQHQMQLVITQLKQELFAKNKQNAELNAHIGELTKLSKEYRERVQQRPDNLIVSGPSVQVSQLTLPQPPAGRVDRHRPGPHSPVEQLDCPRYTTIQQHEQQIRSKMKQQVTPAQYYERRAAEQDAQQRAQAESNEFIKKCEAVRDPHDQAHQQLQPLQFPSFESGSTVPDPTQELKMNFAFDGQIQNNGHSAMLL